MDKIHNLINDLLNTYIPEQKNRPIVELIDGVSYLGKTEWTQGEKPITKIIINKKIALNDDLLRQTLAHEIIHHHLYQTFGDDVAKHGENFALLADRINSKEGVNFVTPYADQTEFKPNNT